MTPSPDPAEALAREAVALSEKAEPPPWRITRKIRRNGCVSRRVGPAIMRNYNPGNEEHGVRAEADAAFIRHAGTHYATLARDLLDKSERLRAAEGLLREFGIRFACGSGVAYCPACKSIDHFPEGIKHATDCALAAFLACQPAREAT